MHALKILCLPVGNKNFCKWNLKLISWNEVINCYIIMTELIDGHVTLFKEERFKESDRNLISDIRSH